MQTPPYDTVTWFQVGSPDAVAAQRFYTELFGWNCTPDPSDGGAYQLIRYPGAEAASGGIAQLDGDDTAHGIFGVLVRDVAATAAHAEELGGKVLKPPVTTPDGLIFAHLLDVDGNRFLAFSPPPA